MSQITLVDSQDGSTKANGGSPGYSTSSTNDTQPMATLGGREDVVPKTHSARTLVLCFDGTGDQFDADNSNVAVLFSMLKKDDRKQQMVYYQSGIGTYTSHQTVTPWASTIAKTVDQMVAWNLDSHVMDGYGFLMQNYEGGDKICIFGFSRGAYTARALAGMIHKVGLLPASNRQQIPFAYSMYKDAKPETDTPQADKTETDKIETDETDSEADTSGNFKRAFAMDVDIEFIGVWDTVESVGLIPQRLPFSSSNKCIRTFRHAISLDEHRAKFPINPYQHPNEDQEVRGAQMPKAGAKVVSRPCGTDVLEVWFAGCHCDVGGGSVPNNTRHNLARIPLRWMIRQCFLANTGIQFHASLLKTIGLDPEHLKGKVIPRPKMVFDPSDTERISSLKKHIEAVKPDQKKPPRGKGSQKPSCCSSLRTSNMESVGYLGTLLPIGLDGMPRLALPEAEEDMIDALCPIYDQLWRRRAWWLLEMLLPVRRQAGERGFLKWTLNLGYGRAVPSGHECEHDSKGEIKVHRSVQYRQAASKIVFNNEYVPKIRGWKNLKIDWID